MSSVQAWSKRAQAIGASGDKFLYFIVKKEVGRPVKVHSISMDNSTRPQTDPRPCFAYVGQDVDLLGGTATSAILGVGYTCSYGNHYLNNLDLKLAPGQMIGFKILGETGDEVAADVLYEVL